jgi:hypothetical protein
MPVHEERKRVSVLERTDRKCLEGTVFGSWQKLNHGALTERHESGTLGFSTLENPRCGCVRSSRPACWCAGPV